MVSKVYLGLTCPINFRCLPVSSFLGCAPNRPDFLDNDWVVWPATTVILNASGVKDGLAALEINCATFDESATSAENLGTH